MLIERDRRDFPFQVSINPDDTTDILAFLVDARYCFDLYNLDFYGGLVYPGKAGSYRSTDALRRLFAEQAKGRRSFVLIATFNVRDRGASEYAEFLESARQGLLGRAHATANLTDHDADQASRLKLCFPFFCWQQAHASGFEHSCDDVTVYQSSAKLVHFFQTFDFKGIKLPPVPPVTRLIEMANSPLFEMRGQVRRIAVQFPQIG
jgi:hypothetical protein